MTFVISENYLLLTEKIIQRPMLRTRFTTQAYLVLAFLLDLRRLKLITLDPQRVGIPNELQLSAALPARLREVAQRLTAAVAQDPSTESVWKLLTSWNLANDIYDTLGPTLEENQRVTAVSFQNNLLAHTIYVPTEQGRQTVINELTAQLNQHTVTAANQELLTIFEQLNALQWILPAGTAARAQQQLPALPGYAVSHELTTLAQQIITQKKFELDSWLS